MLWLALLVLGSLGCLAADEKTCTIHDGGKYYDLNPLKASQDYELKTSDGRLFVINVCRTVVHETFGLKDVNADEVGGFIRKDHGDFSIGAMNNTLAIQESRPRLTLASGSQCKSKSGDTQMRASTHVEFVCDTSVFGSGKPRLVAQLPPGDDEDACAFFIEWRTHVACPTNEPSGPVGFFAIILVMIISIVMIYLVLGTLYNRFVLRLRGLDQVPQFSIESMRYHGHEAWDWLKDLTGGHRGGGQRIRAESGHFSGGFAGESTSGTNPFSHQHQAAANQGDGGFIRPHNTRTPSAGRAEINPISHHSQIQAQATATLESTNSPPPSRLPFRKLRPKPFDLESTTQEREFMLGDDEADEEDGDDMGVAKPLVIQNPRPAASVPTPTDAGSISTNESHAVRRDLENHDVARL